MAIDTMRGALGVQGFNQPQLLNMGANALVASKAQVAGLTAANNELTAQNAGLVDANNAAQAQIALIRNTFAIAFGTVFLLSLPVAYNYFKGCSEAQAPAVFLPVDTNETLAALENCQSDRSALASKVGKCKELALGYKSSADECIRNWEACRIDLNACNRPATVNSTAAK
jgi:hypothetical protein